MDAAQQAYLDALTDGHPVAVRPAGTAGRGLFATSAVAEGDVLLRDEPFCWAPRPDSRGGAIFRVCCRCGRVLGGSSEQLRRLAHHHGVSCSLPQPLPSLGGAGGEAGDGPDGAAGGSETCGDACAEWLKRAGGRADGWASLRRLVDESGDQFLLLAAQLVGEAVARYAEASEAAREGGAHLLPLRCLSSPRSCQAATSDAALHTSLQAVRACFAAAAERWPSLAEEALTPQEWRRCVGAARANSIGVAVPSPLVLYMAEAEALPAESGERRLLARSVWPVLQRVQAAAALGGGEGGGKGGSEGEGEGESEGESEGEGEGEGEGESEGSGGGEGESSSEEEEEEEEEEEVFFSWGLDAARGGGRRGGKPVSSRCFPPHTGSAVFPLVSLMNHSCEPNVQVIYLESNAAVAIALRGIADGEELCIQYVSAEAPLEERRRELRRRYGFECACALCTSQARRVGKRGRDLHSI